MEGRGTMMKEKKLKKCIDEKKGNTKYKKNGVRKIVEKERGEELEVEKGVCSRAGLYRSRQETLRVP